MTLSLEEITAIHETVEKALSGVQVSLMEKGDSKKNSADKKYGFIAFANKESYTEEVEKVLKSYPLLYLASVSPLSHVPNSVGNYNLYTFRLVNGNGNGNGHKSNGDKINGSAWSVD
jgi:hypothetical protein